MGNIDQLNGIIQRGLTPPPTVPVDPGGSN
jgi:hypothetical protein